MDTIRIPTMVTIRKAAELTGLSYDCLRKKCLMNQIIYVRAGKKILINLEKLVEYLNNPESEGRGEDDEALF